MISPERFTDQAREALGRAQERVVRLRHPALDLEHVLAALLSPPEGLVGDALKRLGVDAQAIAQRLDAELARRPRGMAAGGGFITTRAKAVLEAAASEAQHAGDSYIGTDHLLAAALADQAAPSTRLLAEVGLERQSLRLAIGELRGGRTVDSPDAETKSQALEQYGVDLTALARDGQLDPVIGRDEETT